MNFVHSIKLAFNDIKQKDIISLILLNGIFWSVIWIIAGIYIFKYIYQAIMFAIEMWPFTFLEYDGADFFLVFLWFQAVLVSLGAFFVIFRDLYEDKKSFVVSTGSIALLWFLFFVINYDFISDFLQTLIISIFPVKNIEEIIAAIVSLFIIYSFYMSTLYFGFSVVIHKRLKKLKELHYPDIEARDKKVSFFRLFMIMLIDLIIVLIAIFISYPVLFIPFLNILFVVFIWSFLTKEIISEFIIQLFGKRIKIKTIWWSAVFSVVFNFIPILNFFAPAVGIFFLYRYIFEKEKSKKAISSLKELTEKEPKKRSLFKNKRL